MSAAFPIPFDNLFARELPDAGVHLGPQPSPAPAWLHFNAPLADALGLDVQRLSGTEGLDWFSGRALPPGAQPMAQAYAGHQFGGFSPTLGDGRALLLGDALRPDGQRYDLAFKGSGPTPFARRGDGKAAVGPVLRELLMGEAFAALGIPTTRVLAAVRTGEMVRRDRPLPGAMLTRVAASHLRVGTFEFFAARQDLALLRRVFQHAVARHDPGLLDIADEGERCLAFFDAVMARQARLVAQWMSVGFIHGVMNTDNMALSGETIDFGPCAMLEAYDPAAVFSSIDHHGRYAYGAQPGIAQWNLARLAESLLPLIGEDADQAAERASEHLQQFPDAFALAWRQAMNAKLGLDPEGAAHEGLAEDFLQQLQRAQADFTRGFHQLGRLAWDAGATHPLLPDDAVWQDWRRRWHGALREQGQAAEAVSTRMRHANPWIIARNHQVETALSAASDHGDLGPFERLLAALRSPFDERPALADLAEPAPAGFTAGYQTFCGT